MALGINPQDLVAKQFFAKSPDTKTRLLETLTGALQKGRQQNAAADKKKLFADGAQSAYRGEQDPEQMSRMFASDPELANNLMKSANVFTENGRNQLSRTVSSIIAMQDPAQRTQALNGVAQKMQASGEDPGAFARMAQMSPEQQIKALKTYQFGAMSISEQNTQNNADRTFGEKQRVNDASIANQQGQLSLAQNRLAFDQQPKAPKASAYSQQAVDMGLTKGSPEHKAMVRQLATQSKGATINIGGQNNALTKATEGQLKSSAFANRMAVNAKDLADLEDGGYDPGTLTARIGGTVPGGNYIASEEGQLYNAAKQDFILAQLRDESGAAIGSDEYAREEEKFFPMPGDGKKTIAAKRERRARAARSMAIKSKGVYEAQYMNGGSSQDKSNKQLMKDLGL